MRKAVFGCSLIAAVLLSGGCALQPLGPPVSPSSLSMVDIVDMHRQGVSDEALIQQIDQRGLELSFLRGDADRLREAGVSEGVVRYLEGRADGERDEARRWQRERYARNYYLVDPMFLGLYFGHVHYALRHGHRHGHRHRRH